jgi:hypothetical protein
MNNVPIFWELLNEFKEDGPNILGVSKGNGPDMCVPAASIGFQTK